RGWSHGRVAVGVKRLAAERGEPEPGVDAATVIGWDRGIDRPRSRLVSLLCALFELPARELGLAQERAAGPIESGGAVDDEPARRQFVEKVAELLSTAKEPAEFPKPGSDPLERLLHTLSKR